MATVLDAAEYIQEQIEEDNIPYFKLERLCYYAQAWSKAGDEEPIYPEAFSQAKRALSVTNCLMAQGISCLYLLRTAQALGRTCRRLQRHD